MGGSGPLDAGRHVPLPAAPIVRARGVQKADGQCVDVPAVRQDAQTAWPSALRGARGHKGAGSCRERALAHRSGSSWDRLLPRCRSGARRRSAVLGYSPRRGGESWTAALRWTGGVTAGGFRQAARFLYQRPRRDELPRPISLTAANPHPRLSSISSAREAEAEGQAGKRPNAPGVCPGADEGRRGQDNNGIHS